MSKLSKTVFSKPARVKHRKRERTRPVAGEKSKHSKHKVDHRTRARQAAGLILGWSDGRICLSRINCPC